MVCTWTPCYFRQVRMNWRCHGVNVASIALSSAFYPGFCRDSEPPSWYGTLDISETCLVWEQGGNPLWPPIHKVRECACTHETDPNPSPAAAELQIPTGLCHKEDPVLPPCTRVASVFNIKWKMFVTTLNYAETMGEKCCLELYVVEMLFYVVFPTLLPEPRTTFLIKQLGHAILNNIFICVCAI
jgi:hypothetical protein